VLRRFSSHELSELRAYYELEPWGNEMFLLAFLGAVMLNAWGKGRHSPYDLLPVEEYRTPQTGIEQIAILRGVFGAS
jgi:hypothetical protein